ncbi:HTH domain-containing protein [Natronorubrum halalkaliphilum]|uniref:HTH domain-containing protein n=1 Tax=Natronorubrum halalkaliphilum TaxID=2691917 RepID=UPI00191648BA|nr:HTH domain-containing protein [Natronorubrum halalkaliphilum]
MTEQTENAATKRAVLYLRQRTSPEIVQQLRQTVARVRQIEDDGIADVEIKTWGSVNPALEEISDSGPSVSLTVKSFQSWADREGYTLRPAFERREISSLLSSQPATEIQIPIICVAVYEGDDLRCVAPCSDGEQTYSVENCLAALEVGLTDPFALETQIEAKREKSSNETLQDQK